MSDPGTLAGEVGPPRWAVRLGAILGPVGGALLWFAPLSLPAPAQHLGAIAWTVLIAWVTEVLPLPVTALLIAPALVSSGIMPAKKAFAAYADPILFLFVGSFFAGRAMQRHGLDQRFARALTQSPLFSGRPSRQRAAVTLGAMLLSMWISNTATTAVLLPVLVGMLGTRDRSEPDTFTSGSLMALAHASTTGGLATLVGTPPNAITVRILADAGHRLGFLDWMKIGVPVSLLMTLLIFWVIQRNLPADSSLAPVATGALAVTRPPQPWSQAERITALSFGLMVLGWLLPDLAKAFGAPWADVLAERLEPGAVALTASAVLFALPTKAGGPRVLGWRDGVQIEWGLILLFGGGIALGEAMFQTGLARILGESFIALTGVTGLWSLTAASLLLAIVLTEFCSNVAAANMLVPLVIGAAQELHVSPVAPALAAGIGASCGFMLPVATGPNALVYGTGQVSARTMIRLGARIDVLAFGLVFVLLYLLCPLLGFR